LHQVGDLFELNVKLRYQKINITMLALPVRCCGTPEFVQQRKICENEGKKRD